MSRSKDGQHKKARSDSNEELAQMLLGSKISFGIVTFHLYNNSGLCVLSLRDRQLRA